MEYLQDAKEIFEETFRPDWMDNSEWQRAKVYVYNMTGLTYEKLAKDIKTGVENGHSVEEQKDILRRIIKQIPGAI